MPRNYAAFVLMFLKYKIYSPKYFVILPVVNDEMPVIKCKISQFGKTYCAKQWEVCENAQGTCGNAHILGCLKKCDWDRNQGIMVLA